MLNLIFAVFAITLGAAMAVAGVVYFSPGQALEGQDGRQVVSGFAAFEHSAALHERFGYASAPEDLAQLRQRTDMTALPNLPGEGYWELKEASIDGEPYTLLCAHFERTIPDSWHAQMRQRFSAQALANGEPPGQEIADAELCDQWQSGQSLGMLLLRH